MAARQILDGLVLIAFLGSYAYLQTIKMLISLCKYAQLTGAFWQNLNKDRQASVYSLKEASNINKIQ